MVLRLTFPVKSNKVKSMGALMYTTGNHLDFRLYVNGNTVNPLDYVTPG